MAGRARLDHIDAMRPLKQAGVVSTHTVIAFTPTAALVFSNATLLLLHVSREAFFVISACMLTYAYSGLNRTTMGKFYRRRFVSVGIPYLCWNVIYFLWFLYVLRTSSYDSLGSALKHFGRQLEIGYDQLYFLIVIMEFYLVFPLLLALLRRTRGHHALVVAAAAVAQFAIAIGLHWNLFPHVVNEYAQENALCYVLYLVGGAVIAYHMKDVHDWVCRNAVLIVFLTVAATVFAEGVYFLTRGGGPRALGHGSDPFQPSVIPFNVGVIACGYLAGIYLVRPWRHRWVKAAVKMGSDDSYGIYLAQMIFITALSTLGWRTFAVQAPFWVWIPLTVGIAYFGSIALTELLARTPLAVPLTGRARVPWRTPPRREAAVAAVPVPASAALARASAAPAPASAVPASAVPASAAVSEPAPAPAPAPAARNR